MNITVVGSFMMDLVVRSPRAPMNGETVIGTSFSQFPGGKGANQAISAARLGGEVTMVGKIGSDKFGDEILAVLDKEQIHTKYILRDHHHPTGLGFITLENNGNNRIIVVPGANLYYNLSELGNIKELIRKSDIILLQLEMDIRVVEMVITIASTLNVPIILDPAPSSKLSNTLLSKVTYLIPNKNEAAFLTGVDVKTRDDAKIAAQKLINTGVKHVVITLGNDGSLLADETGFYHMPGYKVDQIDSVSAGDAFSGAFAVGVLSGKSLEEVLTFANAAGALATTKNGAIPSIPCLDEVQTFIKRNEAKEIVPI